MDKKTRSFFIILVFSLLALSQLFCGPSAPANETPPAQGAVETQVAQTLAAQVGGADPTSTAPEGPPPAGLPTISADLDTNCRQGPGKDYPEVGFLLVGQQSTVHGKEPSGNWWYIEDPRKPGQFCWVWEGSTQVTGDTSSVPIVAAPPPPVATDTEIPSEMPTETQPPSYSRMDFGFNKCDVSWGPLQENVDEADMIQLATEAGANGFTYHEGLGYGKLLIGNYPMDCKSPTSESWPLYLKD